ncbi:hypothetical protein GCM10022267_37750 [Lentzea roselyniae]|uniref:Uncharacterized protein n=1 Tax=Lentzea roselyniae TaxID=531940 RepID=A0ABP7B443_9PSEU
MEAGVDSVTVTTSIPLSYPGGVERNRSTDRFSSCSVKHARGLSQKIAKEAHVRVPAAPAEKIKDFDAKVYHTAAEILR